MKIAKYISPQIYKSIFSGQRDAAIATERKKLTIFFSDIKDFTATTERLQPEDLTALLNEYFTEMSNIALRHGATVDKFIGDAMLLFFGDPETKGPAGDARACLEMAVEMQKRLAELNTEWRRRGIEKPFQARMGINTGFCNVGNFGSEDRMDYTIIGAEANLAARLQSIAEPNGIVMSYETYALVRDIVRGASAAADHDEGHQPRGGAVCGRRPCRRDRAARACDQRAVAGRRAVHRSRRDQSRTGRPRARACSKTRSPRSTARRSRPDGPFAASFRICETPAPASYIRPHEQSIRKRAATTTFVDDLPDRAVSEHPNFVTAQGLALIEDALVARACRIRRRRRRRMTAPRSRAAAAICATGPRADRRRS